MAPARSVVVVGATGLVGGECVRLLVADAAFSRVVTLTRRPLPAEFQTAESSGKLESQLIDFERQESYAQFLAIDAVICALGTTIRQAGSRERFRHVDYDYPLAIARAALDQGARHFLLVSALSANARSPIFYSRVKGELQDAVLALPYASVTIVQPSFLVGDRVESRLGEELGKRLAFLIPGNYKPVTAIAVATVLVAEAREGRPGRRIIESAKIRALAAQSRSTGS